MKRIGLSFIINHFHTHIVSIGQIDTEYFFIGAGVFWDVKGTHRSVAIPQGIKRPIHAYGYILKTFDGGASFRKLLMAF